MNFVRKDRKNRAVGRNGLISTVIFGAVFGLASGAVGMLMALAYLPTIAGSDLSGYGVPIEPVVIRARLSSDMVVRGLAGPTALLYRSSDLTDVILPSDAIGGGAVLTSDGWLLTHRRVLEQAGSSTGRGLTAVIGGRTYAVERATVDSFSDVAFVKVDGTGLPVVSLGNKSDDLKVGDSVVTFDFLGGLRTAVVTAWGNVPAVDAAAVRRSSEKMQKVVFLAGTEGFLPGSAVFGTSGEVTGIYVGGSEPGMQVVPFSAFSRQISGVLRDGSVVRPYLGVRFIDLSEQPGRGTAGRGALLSSYGSLPAIVRQSPAAKSGLREGDTVLAINGESVTANRSLPELLTEYSPGDTVTISVERGSETRDVEVLLGQMPTP